MHEYFYHVYAFMWFLVWLALFYVGARRTRKMLLLGVGAGVITFPQDFYFFSKDYWEPLPLGLERMVLDFLFGSAAAGIAATVFHSFFDRRISIQKNYPGRLALTILLFVLNSIMTGLFHLWINSIYGSILILLVTFLVIIILRPDLMPVSLFSGFSLLILMILTYQISLLAWPNLFSVLWKLKNVSQLFIFHIPLEEYLWFFSAGLATGPICYFLKGEKIVFSHTPESEAWEAVNSRRRGFSP